MLSHIGVPIAAIMIPVDAATVITVISPGMYLDIPSIVESKMIYAAEAAPVHAHGLISVHFRKMKANVTIIGIAAA